MSTEHLNSAVLNTEFPFLKREGKKPCKLKFFLWYLINNPKFKSECLKWRWSFGSRTIMSKPRVQRESLNPGEHAFYRHNLSTPSYKCRTQRQQKKDYKIIGLKPKKVSWCGWGVWRSTGLCWWWWQQYCWELARPTTSCPSEQVT